MNNENNTNLKTHQTKVQQQTNILIYSSNYFCRICLDQCPNIRYCACTGSVLSHQKCLIQYITFSNTQKQSIQMCQICKVPYKFKYRESYECSIEHLNQRISEYSLICSIYSLLCGIGIMFYGYTIIYYGIISLIYDIRGVMKILIWSISIIFLMLLISWIYFFVIRFKRQLQGIEQIVEQVSMIKNSEQKIKRRNMVAPLDLITQS